MKKKLALLLVLSMVLSMIPMSVFSAAPSWAIEQARVYNIPKANGEERTVTLSLDARWLATSESAIELELLGKYAVFGTDNVTAVSSGSRVFTPDSAAAGKRVATLDPTGTQYDPPSTRGAEFITVTFPVVLDGDDAGNGYKFNVRVAILDDDTNIYEDTAELTYATVNEESLSVTFDKSNIVEFTDSVKLGRITFTETAIGQIDGLSLDGSTSDEAHLMFVIETAGFEWGGNRFRVDSNRYVNHPKPWVGTGHGTGGNTATNFDGDNPLKDEYYHNFNKGSDEYVVGAAHYLGTYNNKPAIVVNIDQIDITAKQSGPAEIYIEELGILPTDLAKYDSKIMVKPYLIDEGTASGLDSDAFALVTKDKNSDDNWKDWDAFQVATYVRYGLETAYDKDEDVDDFILQSGDVDQETVMFHLQEVTPFSWGGNRASATLFEVPEGVMISSVDVTLSNNLDDDPLIDDKSYRVEKNALRNTDGVLVKAESVSIAPYIDTNKYGVYENMLWDLQVKLYLSIEPGYVQKYTNDTIKVKVSGAAIGDKTIKGEGAEFVIATVQDPISLDVEPIEIPADTSGAYEVNSITIQENYGGALKVDTRLTIGLATELGLSALEMANVSVSTKNGLAIGRVSHGTNSISFDITRESDDESDGDAILITGNKLFAMAFSGHSYDICVSNTAVANSDMYDHDYAKDENVNYNSTTGAYDRRYDLFDDKYYATPLVKFSTSTVDSVTNNANNNNNIFDQSAKRYLIDALRASEPLSNGYTGVVFRYVNVGNQNAVAFVSARYLADWLGGDTTWNNPQATFTYNGTTVSVILGSTKMSVNGIEYDIAEYAQNSGPAGTIRAQAVEPGAIFLPLRAICNAFGIGISYDSGVTTISK